MCRLSLVVVFVCASTPALADRGATEVLSRAALPRASTAFGLATSWQQKSDYGDSRRSNLALEAVGFHYRALSRRYHLRLGGRLGFAGFAQPEMPQSLSIREYDLAASAEASVLRDGPVIPSLTIGSGVVGRITKAKAREPIMADVDRLSNVEALPVVYGQVGLGVPIHKGAIVVEPFVRYERVIGDSRLGLRVGIETSILAF